MLNRAQRQAALLINKPPKFWACECGQMNPRDNDYCCTCGGDREDNWEGNDRAVILREEQWDTE